MVSQLIVETCLNPSKLARRRLFAIDQNHPQKEISISSNQGCSPSLPKFDCTNANTSLCLFCQMLSQTLDLIVLLHSAVVGDCGDCLFMVGGIENIEFKQFTEGPKGLKMPYMCILSNEAL
jgi:hypothetical protein